MELDTLLMSEQPAQPRARQKKRRPSFVGRLLNKVAQTIGWSGAQSRKVRFQPETAVFEFERQLLGGGGVPDGDAVALGLGPRCARPSRAIGNLCSR